jgi:hypothetical protein
MLLFSLPVGAGVVRAAVVVGFNAVVYSLHMCGAAPTWRLLPLYWIRALPDRPILLHEHLALIPRASLPVWVAISCICWLSFLPKPWAIWNRLAD